MHYSKLDLEPPRLQLHFFNSEASLSLLARVDQENETAEITHTNQSTSLSQTYNCPQLPNPSPTSFFMRLQQSGPIKLDLGMSAFTPLHSFSLLALVHFS